MRTFSQIKNKNYNLHQFRNLERLKQLQILECKLNDFYPFWPRLDRRSRILVIGGTILKTLFGTATLADLNKLHNILDKLEYKNFDLVQSLSNQITYVKKLYTLTGINSQAIANFTTVIMDNLIHSHKKFQNMIKDIAWLHITVKDRFPYLQR
jgi:hypothetical protein